MVRKLISPEGEPGSPPCLPCCALPCSVLAQQTHSAPAHCSSRPRCHQLGPNLAASSQGELDPARCAESDRGVSGPGKGQALETQLCLEAPQGPWMLSPVR